MSKKQRNSITKRRGRAGASHKNQNSGTNRKHKDRLFKALFGSSERKELTLELYNALRGSAYTNPGDIELTTIDDVVYMGMKNDVSFLFDQTMHLWEQQSTWNPNMPLRFLLYYAHLLERRVHELSPEEGSIYSGSLIQIPAPEPVLFYNGLGTVPEYLHLSDAFQDRTRRQVEFDVRVININSGQDQILELCQPLHDYTTFIEAFRAYREGNNISYRAAAGRAIVELPDGTVKSYLRAHESEVIDMLLTEYDEQKVLKAEYYAGMRAGIAQGRAEALAQYQDEMAAKDVAMAAKDAEIECLRAQLAATTDGVDQSN